MHFLCPDAAWCSGSAVARVHVSVCLCDIAAMSLSVEHKQGKVTQYLIFKVQSVSSFMFSFNKDFI